MFASMAKYTPDRPPPSLKHAKNRFEKVSTSCAIAARRRYLLAMDEHRSDHTICRYNVADHSPYTTTKLQHSIRERIGVRMPFGVVKLKYSTFFADDTLLKAAKFSTSLWIFECFVGLSMQVCPILTSEFSFHILNVRIWKLANCSSFTIPIWMSP